MQLTPLPSQASAPAPSSPAHAAHPSGFHQLLSELNPLQYLPVVGTLYRAVTGDTIPETARFAGSLVVSGLTGGPVGVALNVGATALEHLLGIDPEKIGNHLLAELGIGGHAPPVRMAGAAPSPSGVQAGTAPARAWTAAQLTAYGVTSGGPGQISRGGVSGADVLNGLELARLGGGSAFA